MALVPGRFTVLVAWPLASNVPVKAWRVVPCGRLQQGTTRHAFTGTFDANGQATNTVNRPGTNAITAELLLERNSQITGRIGDGSWRAVLIADRAAFDARTNPATNFANHY